MGAGSAALQTFGSLQPYLGCWESRQKCCHLADVEGSLPPHSHHNFLPYFPWERPHLLLDWAALGSFLGSGCKSGHCG